VLDPEAMTHRVILGDDEDDEDSDGE